MRQSDIKNRQSYFSNNSKRIFKEVYELSKKDKLDFVLLDKGVDITNNITGLDVISYCSEERDILEELKRYEEIRRMPGIHLMEAYHGRCGTEEDIEELVESCNKNIERINNILKSKEFIHDEMSIRVKFLPVNSAPDGVLRTGMVSTKTKEFILSGEDFKNIYLGESAIIGSFYKTTEINREYDERSRYRENQFRYWNKEVYKRDDYTLYIRRIPEDDDLKDIDFNDTTKIRSLLNPNQRKNFDYIVNNGGLDKLKEKYYSRLNDNGSEFLTLVVLGALICSVIAELNPENTSGIDYTHNEDNIVDGEAQNEELQNSEIDIENNTSYDPEVDAEQLLGGESGWDLDYDDDYDNYDELESTRDFDSCFDSYSDSGSGGDF